TPFSDQLPTLDPPKHTDHRALLMALITPKRLKENEELMWALADQQIDTFISRGECEFISDFAQPFAVLVISDLLGVPAEDRIKFRQRLLQDEQVYAAGRDSDEGKKIQHSQWHRMCDALSAYIEQRRRTPRVDNLTGRAKATFPDKSVPAPLDYARIATG